MVNRKRLSFSETTPCLKCMKKVKVGKQLCPILDLCTATTLLNPFLRFLAVFGGFAEMLTDGRTNGHTDGWTYGRADGHVDGRTNRRIDRPSDRDASTHLKME